MHLEHVVSCLVSTHPVYITSYYLYRCTPGTQSNPDIERVALTNLELASGDAFLPHSGNVSQEQVGTTESSAMLEFVDQNQSYTTQIDHTMDSTRYSTADVDTEIKNFFERPIQIFSRDWNVNSGVDDLFYPWDLWMRNPRVANRMSNFRLFKGILHVKFLINGNQFYWGKMLASYTPRNNSDYVKYENTINSIMPATQRPHLWIDPSTSQGGELVLPFFHNLDALDVTLENEGVQLGSIWLKSLVDLQHTQSNVSKPVRLTVYAWCEGIELSSPTQSNFGDLTPQAGEVKDEYSHAGVVSKPAGAVASIAAALSGVPYIGPFAMATAQYATAVASAALALGYSRPRIIEPAKPVKVWQTGDLASTDQRDDTCTLALTTKQEVTIDPRTTGLNGVDEMSFSYLNSIPTYFATTNWNLDDSQYQPLISIAVTPMMYNIGSNVIPPSADGYVLSPTAFTTLPFEIWRGEMTYRFQIAASGYHKGRLLIVWDPVTSKAVPELNTVYSKIVDIAEERDFSVTVGWGNPFPALRVPSPIVDVITSVPYTTRGLHSDGVSNGILTVYVLNDLVSSGDNTAPVSILCHSYSEKMSAWGPNSTHINTTSFVAQSGEVQSDENTPTVADAPYSDAKMNRVGGREVDHLSQVLCGEDIKSFRCCLKRYNQVSSLFINSTLPPNSISTIKYGFSGYWQGRGTVDGGGWPQTMLSYVTENYAGWRGSTRHKFLRTADDGKIAQPRVGRYPNVGWSLNPIIENDPLTFENLQDKVTVDDKSWSGEQMTNRQSGGVLDVEIPWYSTTRFAFPFQDVDSSTLGGEFSTFAINPDNAGAQEIYSSWAHYSAIGEDYNTFFFLGVQPMWLLADLPVPPRSQ